MVPIYEIDGGVRKRESFHYMDFRTIISDASPRSPKNIFSRPICVEVGLTQTGEKQTLTLSRHKELDAGTIRAIFHQASRYIPEDQLRPHLFQ
jgi:hypothetical protein